MKKFMLSAILLFGGALPMAQVSRAGQSGLDQQAKAPEPPLIECRRHFHQKPGLPNLEYKIGAQIADEKYGLGLGVKYPVARTGFMTISKGGVKSLLALSTDYIYSTK